MILRVVEMGAVPFREARQMQERTAARRTAGEDPDTLLLLEHPPTITLGRGAGRSHVLAAEIDLEARGIALEETDRGGDVTYHGPGQLVGYPIFDLRAEPHTPDLHHYLRQLEECLIQALKSFDIRAGRFPGYTGVWTGLATSHPAKIAAIGVRVRRWITEHGFALNVSTCLQDFDTIVPCGISEYGVTSVSSVMGRNVSVGEAVPAVRESFAAVFGLELELAGPR